MTNETKSTNFTCVEAEENILRRMLLKQGVAEDVVSVLDRRDFSSLEYGQIYGAIQGLVTAGKSVDLISVDAELTQTYGAGGWNPQTLARVAIRNDHTITNWQDIKDLVNLVREHSARRQAIAFFEEKLNELKDPTHDVGGVLNEVGTVAGEINPGGSRWTGIGDVLLDTYSYIERRQKGEIKAITSGLKCLDKIIGGFFDGELTVIAARPSVGKSAFGVNIGLSAANERFKVGVVSCEMSNIGIGQRLFSHGAWVDGMKIRRGDLDSDAWSKLAESMPELSELPIQFLFDCNAVEDVVSAVQKKVRAGEINMLIIDYLQFMDTKKTFKEERLRIGYISKTLKRLAQQANIPVIALAQVTREGEGAMPTMKMLRESGNIEQDADGIIFLHRPTSTKDPTVYPEDKAGWDAWKENGMTYLSIGVAKQRNGAIGQVNVLFDAGLMRYSEILREAETCSQNG